MGIVYICLNLSDQHWWGFYSIGVQTARTFQKKKNGNIVNFLQKKYKYRVFRVA
jgi:hypothetical protein